jgi:site-specific DNA recombinase
MITLRTTLRQRHNTRQWIVAEGSHKPLKTQEEHERILAILNSRRLRPKGSRNNIQVLTKLLYCGKCGRTMSFTNKPNGKVHVKTCTKADHLGNRCRNSGMDVEIVYAQLFFDLEQYEQNLMNRDPQGQKADNSTLRLALQNKQEELERLESGIERIKELFIEGIIDKAEMKKRIDKQNQLIQAKKEEIRSIEQSLAVAESSRTDEDRLNAIRRFKEAWNMEGISKEELNKLAKEIIDRIELIREGDNVQINIQFK